ncbi:MAG: thiamine-phosphate kinase [Enterobacteriaceae bacterium]
MSEGEFELIAHYFNRPGVRRYDVRLGVGDDCALMQLDAQQMLAVSTDTLVEGTHFLPGSAPADIAYKALAVNLSDLAAMGAQPAWLTLALTLPEASPVWLQAFSDELYRGLAEQEMQLVGGDTTKGPLSITLTVFGLLPLGRSLLRSAAVAGDWIYVTGTLGDSAAGLALLQERLEVTHKGDRDTLLQRHLRPTPRLMTGHTILGLATAAIDISDGLLADLGHILLASGCGACIEVDKLPLSEAFKRHVPAQQQLSYALTGGEDYELCFCVPDSRRHAVEQALTRKGESFTVIGRITDKQGQLTLLQNGNPVTVEGSGFDHFRG